VRWQLENRPELYDGGVDREGTLFTPDGPDLLTYVPTAVRYTLGRATVAEECAARFALGSEPLWPDHQQVYRGPTQNTNRPQFDPACDPDCPGPTAATTPSQILAPARATRPTTPGSPVPGRSRSTRR